MIWDENQALRTYRSHHFQDPKQLCTFFEPIMSWKQNRGDDIFGRRSYERFRCNQELDIKCSILRESIGLR